MDQMTTEPIPEKDSFFVRDPAFYRTLFVLALPIVLQNMITFGVSFADNVMVGQLGGDAISGLYLGTLIQMVLFLIVAGVESSVLILSAQYWGKHDTHHIKDVLSIGMRIAFIPALLFTAGAVLIPEKIIGVLTNDPSVVHTGALYLKLVGTTYILSTISQMLIAAMRSVEIVRIGLINSIIAFCLNVMLNYVFIFGHFGCPAMEVRGAAAATVISRIVEFSVILYFVLKVDKNLRLRLLDFLRWNRSIFHDVIKYGLPIMAGQFVWAINIAGQRGIIGQISSNALTAASITGMLDNMLNLITWGVAAATGIMVGKAIGAGRTALVKQYARTMQVIFFLFGICCSVIVWQGHPLFMSFYRLSPDACALTHQFMLVLVPIMIGRCYQAPLLFGLVKSGGDTAFVFKNDAFWVFFLVLPGGWLAMHFGAPAWFVYLMLLSDQITKCFVALIKINSFNWIHDLTRPKQTV